MSLLHDDRAPLQAHKIPEPSYSTRKQKQPYSALQYEHENSKPADSPAPLPNGYEQSKAPTDPSKYPSRVPTDGQERYQNDTRRLSNQNPYLADQKFDYKNPIAYSYNEDPRKQFQDPARQDARHIEKPVERFPLCENRSRDDLQRPELRLGTKPEYPKRNPNDFRRAEDIRQPNPYMERDNKSELREPYPPAATRQLENKSPYVFEQNPTRNPLRETFRQADLAQYADRPLVRDPKLSHEQGAKFERADRDLRFERDPRIDRDPRLDQRPDTRFERPIDARMERDLKGGLKYDAEGRLERDPRVERDLRVDPRLERDPRTDPRFDRVELKGDPRMDIRGDPRGDPRGDLRGDPRGFDLRVDPRAIDARADPRGELRGDPRQDRDAFFINRIEKRFERDPLLRGGERDFRLDPRVEVRMDPRMEQRMDPRFETRMDQRGDIRADIRGEPRGEFREEGRPEFRGDLRADPRSVPFDPRLERDYRIDPRARFTDPRAQGPMEQLRGQIPLDRDPRGEKRDPILMERNFRGGPSMDIREERDFRLTGLDRRPEWDRDARGADPRLQDRNQRAPGAVQRPTTFEDERSLRFDARREILTRGDPRVDDPRLREIREQRLAELRGEGQKGRPDETMRRVEMVGRRDFQLPNYQRMYGEGRWEHQRTQHEKRLTPNERLGNSFHEFQEKRGQERSVMERFHLDNQRESRLGMREFHGSRMAERGISQSKLGYQRSAYQGMQSNSAYFQKGSRTPINDRQHAREEGINLYQKKPYVREEERRLQSAKSDKDLKRRVG